MAPDDGLGRLVSPESKFHYIHRSDGTMSNQPHILLAKARTHEYKPVDLRPSGCDYDLITGAWIRRSTGELLVESAWPRPPRTKKADVETGEDQKGH